MAVEACRQVFDQKQGRDRDGLTLKHNVHLRISVLPNVYPFVRAGLPRSQDVGQLVQLRGTVVRAVQPRMLEKTKRLICSRCGGTCEADADYSQFYRLQRPAVCPVGAGCKGTYFNLAAKPEDKNNADTCVDFQEVKIQEQVRFYDSSPKF